MMVVAVPVPLALPLTMNWLPVVPPMSETTVSPLRLAFPVMGCPTVRLALVAPEVKVTRLLPLVVVAL